MKKKFAKIVSCLLCLAMLLSMAGPALAAIAADPDQGIVLAPNLELIDDEFPIEAPDPDGGAATEGSLPAVVAETNPFTQTGEYEIYPTPHSVVYGSGTVTLPATMQVTYGAGIDQYTKDRAAEAFRQAGVTLSESTTTSVKLQAQIKAAGDDVSATTTGLFDKTSAYKLTIDANGVTVVGVDTDAVFYGLTTVKRILQQVTNKQVKHLTVEDYADVPVRGFIEGYYGNPWTVDDRVSLMKFGGDYKMNIYFYAPKDDPKHRNEWKSLYDQDELNDLIIPLAQAGNESKCYFGYALHPFAGNCFRFDTQEHYDEDLAILKAKFLQVIQAGVRQIALLGDDAEMPNNTLDTDINAYVKVLNDLTDWVEEIRTTGVQDSQGNTVRVPDLRSSVPFCPGFMRYADATGNDAVIKSLAPDSVMAGKITGDVPIVMTGGTIWGTVNNDFIQNFKTNVGVGPFLWINWPCTDNDRTRLAMGGHERVLRADLTDANLADIQGIMLNPMQQSEPSKAGIFYNADYAWNVWNDSATSEERMAKVWNDSFKYVDHDSAIETSESQALRELSKHMIDHSQGGADKIYEESVELQPKLNTFLAALENDTLTAQHIADMKAEFQTLLNAARLYKNKTTGNTRILGFPDSDGNYPKQHEQMGPFLDCWLDFAQANLDLLDVMSLIIDNDDGDNDSAIVSQYLTAKQSVDQSKTHGFHYYPNETKYARVGGRYLEPFTNALLTKVAETAKTILDPSALIERIITSRTDTPEGGLEAMRDGNESTIATFKSPNSIAVDDYVGVQYNRPIKLTSVKFVTGAANADDRFNACKLQYMDQNGTWHDIPNATYTHATCAVMEVTGLNLNAKGVRVIATEVRSGTWLGIKEIYINSQPGGEPDEPAPDGKLTGTVIKSSTWSVYQTYTDSKAMDGDDSTFAWYDTGESDDSLVGDYFGLDLGSVQPINRVRFLMGSDKWTNYKLQYSADNSTWTDAGTFTAAEANVELDDVSARYVRFVNTVQVHAWVKVCEIAVYGPAPEANDFAKIAYQSDAVKRMVEPVGVLEDTSASLSADNVMLRPGEFVGIALPGLRRVTDIVAEYTQQPGLVLKAGPSEAELEEITPSGQAARLMAQDADLVRFIRLENESEQTLSFVLDELSVQYESAATTGIVFDSSNMRQLDEYDARRENTAANNTGNWFDGNLRNVAKFRDTQDEGKYVCYDLGQVTPIQKLDVVISDSEQDYIRNGKVQVSMDKENWTDVVVITDDAPSADKTPIQAGWIANYKNANPNTAYWSGSLQAPVDARYLRVVFTETFTDKWLILSEIVINDGAYVSAFNDPAFEVSPIEPSADFTPDKLIDGDLTTGFQPDMTGETSGSLVYHLSEKTALSQINLLAQGTLTGAKLSIRQAGATTFTQLGTLTSGLNQFPVADNVADVAAIQLTWGNCTPTFLELIPVPRAQVAAAGGQAPSAVETVAINSYSGDARVVDFNDNWKFNLGDVSGAGAQVFNDAAWRTVTLPHDFSIEQDYSGSCEAESGYLPGGTGWYRKSFTVDPAWANKTVSINFGGAYMETEVYLNGTKLGENKNGYNPFSFVLSGLKTNGENVIAVKVVNTIPSSRWYSGSGIYRNVHLTVTDPVHVARYGTYVTTTKGTGNAWTVNVKTDVQNDTNAAANVTVEQAIYELDPKTYQKGAKFAETASAASTSPAAGATASVTQTISVQSPKLWNSWDKGTPNLYVLVTTVKQGATVLDTYETEFGFRTIEFTTDVGFKLNDVPTKLKGVCMHHDQGALGAEAWYRAMERQVEILMDMGCNSIRVTHNPAADELIEICNRKGILIIDEAFDCWDRSKNSNSYDFARFFNTDIASDNAVVGGQGKKWYRFVLESMIHRDKNAPCVIMYSLGNEILATSPHDGFITYATNMCDWAEAIDPTRPVTMGDDTRSYNTNGTSVGERVNKIIGERGVVGFNYCHTRGRDVMYNAHSNGWAMYGSETASHVNSRGVYNLSGQINASRTASKLLTSYDKSCVNWGDTAAGAWWYTIRFDYNMGEYVWTGFDYIGEPTPWNGTRSGWVNGEDSPKSSYFGIIDTNGIPKDNYYMYRSMWNETDTTLHVLPTWDRDDLMVDSNGKVEVVVYSNAPVVRVYLNGEEVGASQAKINKSYTGFSNGAGTGEGVYTYRTYETAALQDGGTNTFQPGSTAHSTGGYTGTAMYSTFMVPYEAGTLEVKAFDAQGHEIVNTVGRDVVRTTTGAAKLVATADRKTITNDGKDLSYVTIDVVDAKGEIVNGATPEIKVSVTGDGVFMGLDNGVQPDHTPYHSDIRRAGAGRLVAIVQSTKKAGSFTVSATSDGLAPAAIQVSTGGAAAETGGTNPVSYDISKTIYVQLNTAPDLPQKVDVNLGNGTTVQGTASWNDYNEALLGSVGEFAISGTISIPGYTIPASVGVVVLDDVVALLNYSAAIQAGQEPQLPAGRPAVMADGTVVPAQFEVQWDEMDPKVYKKPGKVIVNGTAEVFGKEYAVTATIRVAAPAYIEGNEATSGTTYYVDGHSVGTSVTNTKPDWADGDAATVWTGSGALGYTYDTAQNIYKLSLTYQGTPPAGGVTFFYSGTSYPGTESANSWIALHPTRSVNGSTVTYQLDKPYSAEAVKLVFANEVKLADVVLTTGLEVFPIGSTAALDGMSINGEAVPAAKLVPGGVIRTSAINAVINPISDDNVAVTILPENTNSRIVIVTESEDHNQRAVYTVQLDAPVGDIDATDDTNDYPRTQTTATAGSDNGGTVGSAVDGNESSIWHSAYDNGSAEANASTKLAGFPEKRWFQLELQTATELSALRYKPRPSQTNGTVKDYRIETSVDGNNWTTVAQGTWDSSNSWKIAMFDHITTAKYVKLWGVNTYGDGAQANYFMAAAEVRVVRAPEADSRIDLSEAVVTVEPDQFPWKNVAIEPGSGAEGATVTVTLRGNVLTKGVDYVLDYENNVDPGTAYLYAKAAEDSTKYRGTAATTFTIVKTDARITDFRPVTLRVHPGVDPTPELPDTVMAFTDAADGQPMEVHVTWEPVPEEWYIAPPDTPKVRTLHGTIDDPDMLSPEAAAQNKRPTATLNIAFSQSVDTVSMVTAVGVVPALPTAVTVRFDDGTHATRTVQKWYKKSDSTNKAPLTVADFNTPGTVELTGDVTGIDRVKAVASVRVAGNDTPMVSGTTNIALNNSDKTYTGSGDTLALKGVQSIFPMALSYFSSGNNNPYQAIKGQTTGSTAVDSRWSDWESGQKHTPTWIAVAFETSTKNVTHKADQQLTLVPHKVNQAKVMFVDEHGTGASAVTYPKNYKIQYYKGNVTDLIFDTKTTYGNPDGIIGGGGPDNKPDGDPKGNGRVKNWTDSPLNNDSNWKDVTVIGTQPAVLSENGQMLTINFEPVDTAILRVLCNPQDANNKWVGVQAFEVYEAVPVANNNFAVTSVKLDGEEKLGSFVTDSSVTNGKMLEVTLPANSDATAGIPKLAVTATNNASISVIQAVRVPGIGEPGRAWAQATVTSEDGSKTETYTVKFTRTGAAAGFFIELDENFPTDKIKLVDAEGHTVSGAAPNAEITIQTTPGYQAQVWVVITEGDKLGEDVTVTNGKFRMPAASVAVYGSATPIPYSIECLLNGGTIGSYPRSYNVERTAPITIPNPTRTGYTFQGWVGYNLTIPTKDLVIPAHSIGNRTYIAVWEANSSIGGGGGNNGGGSVIAPPAGDSSVTTKNPDGSTTVTTTSGGVVTAVTTGADGAQKATIQIPKNSGSSVAASMPALDVTADKAPTVTVENNTGRPMTVTVPVNGGNTIVAVRQEKDGSETVIPYSIVDGSGLRVKLEPGDQTLRLVDNAKTFADVPGDHWAAAAVGFASSRELFNGMGSADTFAPLAPMDRAMMTTVLWRLAEKPATTVTQLFDDVQSGAYYEQAVAWGVAEGVVKGTDNGFEPNTPVSRETLAVMLYRAAGSPVVVDEMPRRFPDGAKVADWAQEAMIWCIQNDIIKGRTDGTLAPQDIANRAEVATMLQRFVDHQV